MKTLQMDWILWLQVLAFLSVTFFVGIYTRKWVQKSSDYFLAGRQLHWLVIGMMSASIIISGAIVPAASGFGYDYGIGGVWYIASWSVGCIAAGFLLVPYWRRAGTYTIPEWYEMRFGVHTRMIFAALYTICTIFAAVCQVVGLGITLSAITGISYQIATWVCGAIYLSYIFFGGIWATAVNSFIQSLICISGMIALLIYLSSEIAPLPDVYTALSSDMLSFPGKMGWGPFVFFSFGGLLWGWISAIWPQQYYYANAVGARTEKHAVKGFLTAGIIAVLFFAWTLPTIGIYGRFLFPNINGETSFAEIIKILPVGLNGFVLLVVLAGAMSTACPQILGVSTLVSREFYKRLFNQEADEKQMMRVTRCLTLVFGIIIILIGSIFPGSSSMMLGVFFALSAPMLPSTLAMMFWSKTTKESCVISALAGSVASVAWMLFGNAALIHASWIGGAVAGPVLIITALATQNKGWWKDGTSANMEKGLTKFDESLLVYIQKGRKTQDKLLDISGGNSVMLGLSMNKLLVAGLVAREATAGKGSLVYHLTDSGNRFLDTDKCTRMICEEDYCILQHIINLSQHGNTRISLADMNQSLKNILPSNVIGPLIINLVEQGLVKEYGLFRIYFKISDKGYRLMADINSDEYGEL